MSNGISINFGAWMRAQRSERHMSQKKLAEKTLRHETSIARWEKGEQYPTLEDAEQIARVFGYELVIVDGTNGRSEE